MPWTVDGAKIAKSGAQAADPATLVADYSADALRWWLLRDPAPVATTDFTIDRLASAYNRALANALGEPCLTRPEPVPTRRSLAHRCYHRCR
jgi:methionyl-tRNA synthetase